MVRLSEDLRRRCLRFGQEVVASYAIGAKERSSAYSLDGADLNSLCQADGRAAECIFALTLGLDPHAVLDWDATRAGADYDVFLDSGLRVDVKSTHPQGRYLIWPLLKNGIYSEKKFDVLALVKQRHGQGWCAGWIHKKGFYRFKRVAGDGTDRDADRRLKPGTWYMHHTSPHIHPIKELPVEIRPLQGA